ncbi:major facilitator superfamily domain-containing protein [Podospora appendiculata]|uniref:Major facilitator superfamily domain-containing protein n=1 Tax=Podospora appendiculata TaxID=314037 RepID=A0AAE0XJN1_9PEZI|nr:major facilitator superfamily domain-containing protein [Podospora appendiculata]
MEEKTTPRPGNSVLDRPDADHRLRAELGPKDIEAGGRLSPAPSTSTDEVQIPTPPALEPPPDGGLQAWLQVLGSTVVLINTWGLINTFGVYQAYYETDLLSSKSPSDISWIGSVQASLLLLMGVFSGPLFDAGYFRSLLITGLFLIVFGQFMTSLCTLYWQILLAQGFCIGIGMGLVFLPSAAIISQYFSRHRALAMGISSAGSPVAGTIFPIIFSRLEPIVGFAWTSRVFAFILLALSIIPVLFMRTRVPPTGRARAIIDKSVFTDGAFVAFASAGFLSFLVLYVPFFYITLFARSHHATTDSFAPYLVTLLNVGSIFGRIIPNALADRLGCLNVLSVCMFVSSIMVLGWMGVHDLGGSVVFTLMYGLFSGAVVSLTPSVIFSMSPDISRVGARLGMNFLVTGISILIGTPIAGAILTDFTDAQWLGVMGYTAGAFILSTILHGIARFVLFKRNGRWKD